MIKQTISTLMKKSSGYIICFFITAAFCAPILSISNTVNYSGKKIVETAGDGDLVENSLNIDLEEACLVNVSDLKFQADFEISDVFTDKYNLYFDPDGFDLANYSRDESTIINRSNPEGSEDLLFGTIDDEFEIDSIPIPPDLTFEEDNTTVYIIADSLSFRELPTVKSDILKTYYFGDAILRTGIGEDWHRVKDSKGNVGYMMSTYFSLTKPTPPPTPTPAPTRAPAKANTLGESIALEVQKYIGIKYRYAQENPNIGFDCSGLTWYVYNRYGISTPRATSVYKTAGIIIPYSEIAPGDVIAWNNGYGNSIDHVGIYIGGGKMVHATLDSGVTMHGVDQYRRWGYRLMSVHRFIKK